MTRQPIELLPKETIDEIAAGEVIERPASVVKELCENSIDAGATAISIEIRNGGKDYIRVTDNGCGILHDEIPEAFMRHATSKIRESGDLMRISTLGFRGEALASIAAVSEVELITRCPDEAFGTDYTITADGKTDEEETGAPAGTTFLVENLFCNTPARRKFLKSDQSEANRIITLVEHLALSHPEISFHLKSGGREIMMTSGSGDLKSTIYQVLGRETANNLIPFQEDNCFFSCRGYLGNYTANRGNRNAEYIFVGRRTVTDKVLSSAIEEGYHGFIMQHQFPLFVLFFEFPTGTVDVNVHPSKREIRLDHAADIYGILADRIHQCLAGREDLKQQELVDRKDTNVPKVTAEPFETDLLQKVTDAIDQHTAEVTGQEQDRTSGVSFSESAMPVRNVTDPEDMTAAATENADNPVSNEQEIPRTGEPGAEKAAGKTPVQGTIFLSPESRKEHHIIGQIFDTYWLVEWGPEVVLIDQHAAHEKVNYERMMQLCREKQMTSQLLSPPVLVTLSREEADALEHCRSSFEALGFAFSPFGEGTYQITGVPANLYSIDPKALFLDIVAGLSDIRPADTDRLITEKIASMACKASVKGNQHLSRLEAERLIDALLTLDEPYHCPHGRPTMVAVTRAELDRLFKRIV